MKALVWKAWVQIPAQPLQAIGSQAVNIACLCLNFPTCKVEMKKKLLCKSVLHGMDEQVISCGTTYKSFAATKEILQPASNSFHNAASRQGRGGLVSDMLTLQTLCTWLCGLCGFVSQSLLSGFGPVRLLSRNLMAIRILTMTSPDNVSGNLCVHKMIQSERAGADEVVSNCVGFALQFSWP